MARVRQCANPLVALLAATTNDAITTSEAPATAMDIFDNLRFDDPLFNLATVLTAGIIGGDIFARIGLPKVTGWIATGILLRSLLLPGMNVQEDPAALDKFKPFMSFVLGYIAFTVGATLYFSRLRNTGKRIGCCCSAKRRSLSLPLPSCCTSSVR